MTEQLLEEKEVVGILWANDEKYYALDLVGLADKNGHPLPACGWWATPSVSINQDELLIAPDAELIYNLPVLIIGGTFISRDKYMPKSVKVLKEFDWNNIDDEPPMDVIKLMAEMMDQPVDDCDELTNGDMK